MSINNVGGQVGDTVAVPEQAVEIIEGKIMGIIVAESVAVTLSRCIQGLKCPTL